MNLVIDHSKTRRSIDGAFVIQGSAADLRELAKEILAQADGADSSLRIWVKVGEPAQEIFFNTRPRCWDNEGSVYTEEDRQRDMHSEEYAREQVYQSNYRR